MSRVLVVGFPPPPYQPNSKVEAAHYRTWQYIQPLLEAGLTVGLCAPRGSERLAPDSLPKNLHWYEVPYDVVGWPRILQAAHDQFDPTCVLGVDFYPSLYATRLRTRHPMWLDLYGDPLTISQVARFRRGSDQGIGTAIALMEQILQRGDMFGTCGIPQQQALVGELAMAGRLNSRTFGCNLVEVVYPGAPPVAVEDNADRAMLRQALGLDSDAFVALWCGGYNTWTDVVTLFKALEHAMAQDARVHYVSVGASTYQAGETQYDRLVSLAARSPYAARFHLLGWRPWQEVPGYYRLADIGVSIDALHYETILGTRTRLVEMLAYGLPAITSAGCELSYLLPVRQSGLNFSVGDWAQLAAHILRLANQPQELELLRGAGRRLVESDLSFATTTAAFRSWVAAPQLAPDRASGHRLGLRQTVTYRLRTLTRLVLWRVGLSGRS
ncbi:MAG: glycosyltransferase family 4 protein [Chloroflexi bacterium]|nr:glycosyltransferase family 4 protein [Chloroflexota bacterium]